MTHYYANVIGAGPNGLAAAIAARPLGKTEIPRSALDFRSISRGIKALTPSAGGEPRRSGILLQAYLPTCREGEPLHKF